MNIVQRIMTTQIFCSLLLLCLFVVPVFCEDKDLLAEFKTKFTEVTSNPRLKKYLTGALLGSAFAAVSQPFKNAKDHFLSSRRGVFVAMKHIAHENGILSLFKGVTLSVLIWLPLASLVTGNLEFIKVKGEELLTMLKGKPESAEQQAERLARETKIKADKDSAAAKAKAESDAKDAAMKRAAAEAAAEAMARAEREAAETEERGLAEDQALVEEQQQEPYSQESAAEETAPFVGETSAGSALNGVSDEADVLNNSNEQEAAVSEPVVEGEARGQTSEEHEHETPAVEADGDGELFV